MLRRTPGRAVSSLAAGLLGGILIALFAPAAWQAGVFGALVAIAVLALIGGWRMLGVAMVAGFLLAQSAAGRVLSATFDCAERRLVIARIDSIPAPQGAGWQYDAWVEPARPPAYPPLRVRISQPGLKPPISGERWQLLLQFDPPATAAGADARRRALLRDHVSATARVRASPLNHLLAPAPASIDGLRLAVADRIRTRVADPSAAALLAALAVGVTADVSTLQWRVFSATGITHLVAISGMHVTFFALLCMALARGLWRRWPGPGARCRRESFAAVTGIVLAFGYALLSGFSVPAQRTALMLAVFLAARCCGRHVAPTWSVAASLVAVLVLDPLAALSAGFWLSFCAVAAIILIAGGRLHPPGTLRAAALVQWVVTIALLPVTAALFGSFSAVGPFVNAVAIPLFTFALVPPVLVATALYLVPLQVAHWCADSLVDLAAWAAQQSWPLLVRAADLPGALLDINATTMWLLIAAPAVLCVLAPLPTAMRLGALALLGSGFAAQAPQPERGTLEVVMLDVGASRAVVLRTAEHQLLLGTGESFGTAGRRFEREVLPELRRSAAAVDVLLDRLDRDSLQGLAMARAGLPLGAVLSGTSRSTPDIPGCVDGRWQWDGVDFTRLAAADGCWLYARAGGRLLVVSPLRVPSGQMPDSGPASIVILPRTARDAAALLARSAPDVLALASLSSSEWQSGSWRALRAHRGGSDRSLWSTASLGSVRLTLRADGRLVRSAATEWQAGIWSAGGRAEACARP